MQQNIDQLYINSLRILSVEAVQKAGSGHPGLPLGAAPMAYTLWAKFLKHNPKNPTWINRDRFILSAGHGSALLYSLLHLTGYNVSINDLQQFRQWGSLTPGHPEYKRTPGVEMTTGPLGQGFATGVGMAIAERFLSNHFNKSHYPIIDYHIYGIVSDGDLMEGVSTEAASLAGNLRLNKLIYFYDDNNISIEGSTELAFCEDVVARFKAFHWQVINVKDGNNIKQIARAIKLAHRDKRPSLIVTHTHIGYGSSKQDSAAAHGSPLGEASVKNLKLKLHWPLQPSFYVPDKVKKFSKQFIKAGQKMEREWNNLFKSYQIKYPQLAHKLLQVDANKLPSFWGKGLPIYSPVSGPVETRVASGEILNKLASNIPMLLGGSADLSPSTKTYLEGAGDMTCHSLGTSQARNLHFGVREHAMGSILNGLALSKLIPFGSTFLVFSDYMRPAIRLAALMGLRVIYIFTHDSIAMGEDGPTHQPIEQLMSLRAIPNLTVIRPADANETTAAWKIALTNVNGPTALILSRQALHVIDRIKYAAADNLKFGAYILNEEIKKPDLIIIATGSEIELALQASQKLADKKIKVRLVNMPSWELFEQQSDEYKNKVLPVKVTARLSIEAGTSLGWQKYVGPYGGIISIDSFGASAPGKIVLDKFGFNLKNIEHVALQLLKK